MGNSLSSMINGFFIVVDGLCFYCLFSYLSLLELQYGGRIRKSQITREQAKETGISVREAECQIDIGLFPQWVPQVGDGSSPPASNPAWDVLTCCWERAERGGAYGLLGLLRQHIRPWPRDCSLCHGISRIPDLLQGDQRYLPECLFTKKATGSSLLWGSMEENHWQYSLFPNRPVA